MIPAYHFGEPIDRYQGQLVYIKQFIRTIIFEYNCYLYRFIRTMHILVNILKNQYI